MKKERKEEKMEGKYSMLLNETFIYLKERYKEIPEKINYSNIIIEKLCYNG